MRPRMKDEDIIPAPKMKRPVDVMAAEIELEQKQAELQKVLDRLERREVFNNHESSGVMCNTCCRVCHYETFPAGRKAYQDSGGDTICGECMSNLGG